MLPWHTPIRIVLQLLTAWYYDVFCQSCGHQQRRRMKSSKQSGSKSSLNRSNLSLLDASDAAEISAHAASHAKPKCKRPWFCYFWLKCFYTLVGHVYFCTGAAEQGGLTLGFVCNFVEYNCFELYQSKVQFWHRTVQSSLPVVFGANSQTAHASSWHHWWQPSVCNKLRGSNCRL